MKLTRIALLALCASLLPRAARAIEIKVSAQALERTLNRQLFTQNGRYYLRGKTGSACYAYAEDPRVSFQDDRVVVHVKVHARLGTSLRGACLGVSLNTEADVAVIPEAEGESIGFRNAQIARLSESRELNFFLVPFLSGKLPQEMKVNVADSLRQLLSSSTGSTGYQFRLDDLKIHSMQVAGGALTVDFDGNLSVQ